MSNTLKVKYNFGAWQKNQALKPEKFKTRIIS